MGDDPRRLFLKIVRRQPVIFGANKGLEKCPGLARTVTQENKLPGGQPRVAAQKRTADPPGNGRGSHPQEQNRPRHHQGRRCNHGEINRRGDAGERPHPH